jgi:3-phenylpropionate/trans-cinnamate dioxygenase ferredoxin subunit
MTQKRSKPPIPIGPADLQSGERRIIEVNGRQIGLFNIGGDYFALHNRCPHMGGNLCEGPVTGTTLVSESAEFIYGRSGEILRCAWHGWEFDIKTGQCLVDGRIRARAYPVTIQDNELFLHL